VLVNEITTDCIAYVASLALPILLAETSIRRGDAEFGALSSDKLPRITDILAAVTDEQLNRGVFRGKWKTMTAFFDPFLADVFRAIAEAGGTITEAPARLDAVSMGVRKQGPRGSPDGPKDHWSFDKKQVEDLVERLRRRRGGHFGKCFYGGGGPKPAPAPAPPPAPPAPPAGGGAAPPPAGGGGKKAKKTKLAGWNLRQDWDRDDVMEAVNN